MNLVEFQQLSKRTMPFGGEPQNHIEFENMLGNYAMGLCGEIIEAYKVRNDKEKLLLELGDVAHYAVGLLSLAKIDIPKPLPYLSVPMNIDEMFNRLIFESGEILEHAKKVIYHRHEFEAWRIESCLLIAQSVSKLAFRNHSTLGLVLVKNIDKLKTRYPEKFSVEDSIARKDVQQ